MGFKRRSRSQLALSLLDTEAGQQLVQERLSEIDGELSELDRSRKKLEAERAQLSPLVQGGRKRRGKGARKNGGTKRGISTQRVLAVLGSEPQTKAELAEQLSANPVRLKKPLEALIEEGSVERVGRGRGTRYRAT